MTNLEMLQSLTVDEVAKFIAFVEKVGVPCRHFKETFYCQCFDYCEGDTCNICIRKWLESEVDYGWNFWSTVLSPYSDVWDTDDVET
jgi:hypothetical protein